MVQNLSQTGNTSSPSANMLSFSTPSGLGIEGATPAGLNIPTPALGGANMVPTMSDLGLTASSGKRSEDDERRIKMRKVLKSIGRPKGRVSEEGIARVSRRVGFANDIDAEKLTPEEKERKVGNRPISTAGNTIVIEVDLKNQVPQNVQVMYSVQSKALEEEGIKAGQVLLEDLKAADGVALNAKLDRFALNLERLARMDRLSSNGVNCFEALSGIYSSLQRLYEQEKQAARDLLKAGTPNVDDRADVEVMCKKSGKPLIHGHGKLGLELVYWQENRHQGIRGEIKSDGAEMDIDGREGNEEGSRTGQDEEQGFTLRIEVEGSPAGLYPSLRVSDTWILEPLDLPGANSVDAAIPWQDPPPTLVPADGAGGAMAVDGQQKLPDLRFVAKLDPPLIMPYQTAANILTALGMQPMFHFTHQYAALLIDPQVDTRQRDQTTSFTMTSERSVLSHKDGQETAVLHKYSFENVKLDFGYKIEELPFSHPRQLIELLPTLRQWACLGSLLKATLTDSTQSTKEQQPLNGSAHTNGISNGKYALDDSHEQLESMQRNDEIQINIDLTTAPTPTLGVTFPALQPANITVQILPNADLVVTNEEGLLPHKDAQTLAKALEACGDLGMWVEWMRTLCA